MAAEVNVNYLCDAKCVSLDGAAAITGANGNSPLHVASSLGHVECVQFILGRGACVDSVNNSLSTPLHLAASRGDVRCSELLIQSGANVNSMDVLKLTPLHRAVQAARVECTRLLLEAGADVNSGADRGYTPLQTALTSGGSECTRLTPAEGTSGDAAKRKHLDAIQLQCRRQCVKLLVEKGADVNSAPDTGVPPLHLAAVNADAICLEMLLEAGSDVSAVDKWGETPVHAAMAHDCSRTHIHHGIPLYNTSGDVQVWSSRLKGKAGKNYTCGKLECFRQLLMAGADMNERNKDKIAPLHHAAAGDVELCTLLVETGADVNITMDTGRVRATGRRKVTPLHIAAECGDPECIKVLLQGSANVNARDGDGNTPIHRAAIHGRSECIQLLVHAGGCLNTVNMFGDSALHITVKFSTVCSEILLQGGASAKVQNRIRETPLHKAARRGKIDSLRLLVASGADVNLVDKMGQPALHAVVCCEESSSESVRCLLEAGARVDIQDNLKQTALLLATRYASSSSKEEIVTVLLEAGSKIDQMDDVWATAVTATVEDNLHNILCLLIKWNGDVDVTDAPLKRRPLYVALCHAKLQMADTLLQAGAGRDVMDAVLAQLDSGGLTHLDPASQGRVHKWIVSQRNVIPSLFHLCRVLIRKMLRRSELQFHSSVQSLEVPKRIQGALINVLSN